MLNLVKLFDSLPPPAATVGGDARFSAMPIPGYQRHRLGRDAQGAPSLLIAVTDKARATWPPPTVLKHLTVQHDVTCRVSRTDRPMDEDQFTVVRCVGDDPGLHGYFLRVAEALVVSLGPRPSARDVTRAIGQLVELFRAMAEAPRKSVQGLWAELLLMTQAPNPTVLVSAWHAMPEDRYDFSLGSQRIEVKSTSSRIRAHQFSLEQLCPPARTSVLIASLFVERTGAGTAVADLLREVRTRVGSSPDLLLQLDRIVSLTLGADWRQAAEVRFDRELAESSLAFFAADDIPKISPTLPPGVSGVHFTSNLTDVPSADPSHWRTMAGLFEAAIQP